MISLLSNMETQISFNDNMMYLGRYPNIGFAHVSNVVTDQTSTGQGTYTNPVGASIALRETVNNAKWNAELNRIQKSTIKGYVSADWYKEELRIHSVNTNGVIRLVDGAKYGFGGASAVERCYIRNMLCEIDEPGEWYFDDIEKKFYLWPQGDINSTTHIGIWAGPTLFEINASYIQIKKLIVQCLGNGKVGDGGVNIPSGSNNLIAGCTFRFIAAPSTAFNITQNATNSGALSCDIFDGGGSRCQSEHG